jgi:hypothetical protein
VMIHFGKAQILKGEMLQSGNGAFGRQRAEAHKIQQLVKFAFLHEFVDAAILGLAFAH